MFINEANCETGEVILKALSSKEIAERESIAEALMVEMQLKTEENAKIKAKREAILERLGITAEEAKVLLG